jgi:hypothetical protein
MSENEVVELSAPVVSVDSQRLQVLTRSAEGRMLLSSWIVHCFLVVLSYVISFFIHLFPPLSTPILVSVLISPEVTYSTSPFYTVSRSILSMYNTFPHHCFAKYFCSVPHFRSYLIVYFQVIWIFEIMDELHHVYITFTTYRPLYPVLQVKLY